MLLTNRIECPISELNSNLALSGLGSKRRYFRFKKRFFDSGNYSYKPERSHQEKDGEYKSSLRNNIGNEYITTNWSPQYLTIRD
jgi:hypothetical protein